MTALLASLQDAIKQHFGNGHPPKIHELVRSDGFDALEKESATAFFSGKSWEDMLHYLRTRDGINRSEYLEEWSVLETAPKLYYLRAYLEYLLEILFQPEVDERFVYYFFGELSQIFHPQMMAHSGNPFNVEQQLLLQKLALFVTEYMVDHAGKFEYFKNDIADNIQHFLAISEDAPAAFS